MDVTGFLKIPGIPGESRRADHEGEIDIHSISWGVARPSAASVGSGRTRSIGVSRAMTVGKFYDASSPYLALASLQGKAFDEVVISFRKDSGEAHLDYLKITLTNVMVSAYDLDTPPEGEILTDAAQFVFEKIKVRYIQQADDHSAGDEHEIEFDISAGA